MKESSIVDTTSKPALHGTSETLFIPVWARAVESCRPDGLTQDTYALRIMKDHSGLSEKYKRAWLSQLGIVSRTRILDRVTSRFLASSPGGTVISLGCGLDARSRRLDNGLARWLDVDLPDVIAHRQGYFESSPRHFAFAGSVLEGGWLEQSAALPDGPNLIIAEGLLMYFSPKEVRGLFSGLAERFPGAEFVFDVLGRRYVGRESSHDSVSKCSAPFRWGVDSFDEVSRLCPELFLIGRENYFDCPPSRLRWVWFIRWLPYVEKTCQIFHARFGEKTDAAPTWRTQQTEKSQ